MKRGEIEQRNIAEMIPIETEREQLKVYGSNFTMKWILTKVFPLYLTVNTEL